jgi:uncharacterized protein (TIGR03437 family)
MVHTRRSCPCSAHNGVYRLRVAVGGFMGNERSGFGRLDLPAIAAGFVCCCVAYAGTPVPTYGTYFGGSGENAIAVAVSPAGEIVIAGTTTSQFLPGTAVAFQSTHAAGFPNNTDVFIAKFDSTGQTLLWSTFLGGDDLDQPTAVIVDASGSIYVIGVTRSSTFPVTADAYLRSNSTEGTNGFAARISADGRSLLYATYLPGTPNAIAVNNVGEAYMVGGFLATAVTAGSIGAGATSVTSSGGVFLLRLNSAGTGLVFGAYLGGGGFNGSVATSVAVDAQGDAYIAGFTGESNIPTTANAFQGQYSNPATGIPCCSNGFIAEVNPSGSKLIYGTYFGTKYFGTAITSLVAAQDGSLYLSGSTNSTTQASPGAYLSAPSAPFAGFIAKLTPGRTMLDSFSYIPSTPSAIEEANVPQLQVLLGIGNQPETVYATFATNSPSGEGPIGFGVVELSVPTLSLLSSFTSPSLGFVPLGAALAAPHSMWVVGSFAQGCPSCSLGNLITSNAFQSMPSSGDGGPVIIQFGDISPNVSFLGSAATGSSPFAAGQLVSIYGTQLGPTPGSSAQENSSGVVSNSNGGTQVLFDGVAAPILYTGASQVNTVIPCSTAGKATTQMVLQYLGAQSSPYTVALNPAAPGIFTSNGSGSGQAVVLNQDYSLNGPANPAARGSAVFFYATGIGPTSPCVDGQTYQSNFPLATLPVVAGVGNLGAQVLYAGQAPSFISGVAQINIVIPGGSPTGVVPLSLLVNGVFSPPGVTIAVK